MKNLSLFIAAAFVAGLFSAGQALAAGQEEGRASGAMQTQQPQEQQQAGAAGEQRLAAEQLNSAQVRELQQNLQEQGVDPGPVDGIWGPQTEQALTQFQQQEGIAATGEVNEETLEALDIEVQEFMGLAPEFEEEPGRQQQQPGQQMQEQQRQEGQQQERQSM